MTSCADGLCGTGTGNFPKPGDPDFNSVLSATPGFGGVQLKWTYPTTNPQAVAHINIYRSTADDVNTAVLHRVETGDSYFDPTTTATAVAYYYWIKIASVNGTEGDLIGPVSATARPTIDDVILGLSGQINSGALANSLKTEIARIETLSGNLLEETEARLSDYNTVSQALASMQDGVDEVAALVTQETQARTSADAAQVKQINLIATKSNDNAALISQEQQVRADADSALAELVTKVNAQLGDDLASVSENFSTHAEAIGALEAEYSVKVSTNINGETIVGGFGLVNDGATVEAGFDVDKFWIGKIGNKRYPFIVDSGTGEVFINEAVVNKLTFDKLVASDGSSAVTGAVYDGQGNLVTPAKLKAENIDVENLVAVAAQSPSYVEGESGWSINKDGTAEFNAADFRGSINFADLTLNGQPLNERITLPEKNSNDYSYIINYGHENEEADESVTQTAGITSVVLEGVSDTSHANIAIQADIDVSAYWYRYYFLFDGYSGPDTEHRSGYIGSVNVQLEYLHANVPDWTPVDSTTLNISKTSTSGNSNTWITDNHTLHLYSSVPVYVGDFTDQYPTTGLVVKFRLRFNNRIYYWNTWDSGKYGKLSITNTSLKGEAFMYKV